MILKQGHNYEPMPHDGKTIWCIYRGGRCYYIASPYSPEATQALKAAFPQYWTAIRDYGVAHPQLVPFINEDPMLIVSLVEVGKTRWLVGDGKAWINTGINASLTRGIEFDFVLRSLSNDHSSICLVDKSSGNEAFGLAFWDKKWVYNYGNYTFRDEAKQDIRYHYKQMGGNILLEGEDGFVRNLTKSASKIIDQAICFPANNRNGSVIIPAILDAPFFKAYEGEDLILHQVPYLHPTEGAGMLDIVSLTFYPNANTEGTFTIQVTDKA